MTGVYLNVTSFCEKHDLLFSEVNRFCRNHYGKIVRKDFIKLNMNEYRSLRDFFTEESGLTAIVFYTPARDKSRYYKNVIRLLKLACNRYRYEWYRYTMINGSLTRTKIDEVDVQELENKRLWKSPIDKSAVLLTEGMDFEPFIALPTRLH